MKNLGKFLLSILMFCFAVSIAGAGVSMMTGIAESVTIPLVTMITLYVTFKSSGRGADYLFKSGIQNEFWVNYIVERFWKDNKFAANAFNEDQYVVGGKIVHIPQPGAKPTIVKNRSIFPATAVRRTDTDILYALDEYTSDPTHIQDAEKVEVSYDKIDSVLGDHAGEVNQLVADDLIIKWASALPAANVISTSGAATAARVAGQTGNRKLFIHEDLKKARTMMNLQNIPGEQRFALIEENMMDDLTGSLSATQYKDFSMYYDAKTGVIGQLYGFNLMTRSSVAIADTSLASGLTVNPLGAAIAATNDVVSICWQKNAVTRAMGEVKFFENQNDPLYYGDVYSALMRMGGRRRRADNAGFVAIKQAATP